MDMSADLYTSDKLRSIKLSRQQFVADNIFKSVINIASSPYTLNELLYNIDTVRIGYMTYKLFDIIMFSYNNLAFDIIKLLRLKFKDDISIFIVYKFNSIDKEFTNMNLRGIDNMINERFYAIPTDIQKITNILENNYRIDSVDINICIKW